MLGFSPLEITGTVATGLGAWAIGRWAFDKAAAVRKRRLEFVALVSTLKSVLRVAGDVKAKVVDEGGIKPGTTLQDVVDFLNSYTPKADETTE